MALEFALRPRLDLERPARKRAFRLRLPRLALPIAAYWLAMAGGTYALLDLLAERPSPGATPKASRPRRAVTPPAPPQAPTLAESTLTDSPGSDSPAVPTLAAPAPTSTPFASEPLPTPAPTQHVPPIAAAPPFARPEPVRARLSVPSAPRTPELEFAPLPAPDRKVADPRPSPSEPEQPVVAHSPRRDDTPTASLPSCEAAAASASQSIDLRSGERGAPDLTRDAFASVLENGTYLGACSIPDRTALEICAAVQDGKVVGVSVNTEPRNAEISACVRRAVARLRFPHSARLDVTRTRFAATGR